MYIVSCEEGLAGSYNYSRFNEWITAHFAKEGNNTNIS
jgi:hypothetical protein